MGQRRATKLVPELRIHRQSETSELTIPGIPKEERRYNPNVQDIDDIYKDDFFTTNTQSTRGHKDKPYKTPSRLDIRKYTFSQRVFQDWNDLSPSAIEAPNILTLKHPDDFRKR